MNSVIENESLTYWAFVAAYCEIDRYLRQVRPVPTFPKGAHYVVEKGPEVIDLSNFKQRKIKNISLLGRALKHS